MATMAVINHTEEELDDDVVSNLSLNLMVSDNEDAGSPNSDRFDKLDSRDDSPDDSNNCDNTEEEMCRTSAHLKNDLQQLRDITGDNCWSALDDVDNNDFSSGVDKKMLIGNKETTSLEDNTKVIQDKILTEELCENTTTNQDVSRNNQHCTKRKEADLQIEEQLLKVGRDNGKDAVQCENLDEDALLSDPRDEDLLQVTEEKTTENDAADFLKSCQEEQEEDEFSCSSTEKAEDNLFESAADYEESNNEPELELADTATNNYENEIDDEISLNSVKDRDGKREDGGESNLKAEDARTENEDVLMHSKEHGTKRMMCFNTTTDIVDKHTIAEETLEDENSHEESNRLESEKHIRIDAEHEILLNQAKKSTKIHDETSDLLDTDVSDKQIATLADDMSSKGEDDTISDNASDVNNAYAVVEHTSTLEDTIFDCKDATKKDHTRENIRGKSEGDVIPSDDCEVFNANEEANNSPTQCATKEEMPKKGVMIGQIDNEASGIITDGNNELMIANDEELSYVIMNGHEKSALVEIEAGGTNEKPAKAVDCSAVAEIQTETDGEPMDVDDMEFDIAPIQEFVDKDALCKSNNADVVELFDGTEERTKSTTNNADNNKDDCRNTVQFVHDNKLNPSVSPDNDVQDLNIINLIEESEVITDSVQTAMLNVRQGADAHDIHPTTDSLQSTFLHATSTPKASGIEGDNKMCEDMDIEEIKPYKEIATRPNGSVLLQILSTNSVPDTVSATSSVACLPTITDNTAVLVSPQPGEKRLSNDNFNTESSKRRKLATPAIREIRQKYLESFKEAMASASWSRIGRRQLEEFATQKLLEAIHYKTEMGELHKKCMEYKQSLENLRTNSLTLTKQLRDMNSVHIKLEREINILKVRHRDDDKPLVAVKITRSVGLQAFVEDSKVNRRGRPMSAARTATQNQLIPVLQKQQVTQPPNPTPPSHPPQLQQKPMIQQKPVQVQVPQRVVMGTSVAPPLQPRPVRNIASVPAGVSPVQTRTMSRNKKIAAVSSTNPPPLRSLNNQQQSNPANNNSLPPGSTISIPIKHITGPTILNKSIAVSIPTVTTPVITTPMTETSKAVIDLTDEDDVGKKLSPVKVNQPPQQQQPQQPQQQRITLMSTVVNGQQVLLRVVTPVSSAIPPFNTSPMFISYPHRPVHSAPAPYQMTSKHLVLSEGGGPIPTKASNVLTNGTPLYVQAPMQQQQRTAPTHAPKPMTNAPPRTRTSTAVQTPIASQQTGALTPATTQSSPPTQSRRFRHPAPLPTPPTSQSLIKGNKPVPPKPTVTVNKSPNGSGIIVKWNMPSMLSLFEKIVRYELFVYQVTKSPPRTDSWGKINDVGALDLPMAVSLTEFAEGNRYYFAVRAVDELGRLGPFSEPQTIVF